MSLNFEDINSPEQLRRIDVKDLPDYAHYLRNFLIEQIAAHGGHFAANLGVVELTVALHYVYNTPEDILVWDVGHQAYAHKIISGRKSDFATLRKWKGLSGFPKMAESHYDAFGTGHSSTSISAVLGYAEAALIQKISRQHLAVIGDGALSAGQAFEALNNAAVSKSNITIIINDNHIGIDPSQGAIGEYLDTMSHQTDSIFTSLGLRYLGTIDGHHIEGLIQVMEEAKKIDAPKVIHVKTIKGKGYAPAEKEQTKWHSTSQFDKISGLNTQSKTGLAKYQDIFGKTLVELAEMDKRITAVTPAMISGSSLHEMQEKFPERLFDVGIAEQHALTFSAGLAASGLIPFCCIYSTFLQRAYDQLIHDIALQNIPLILAVDRAGLVGEDGPTHHGVFDISFLQCIPNLRIFAPRNQNELRNIMFTAVQNLKGPVVIRYPRGEADEAFVASPFQLVDEKPICIRQGSRRLALISVGPIWKECSLAVEELGMSHFDLRCIKPLDISFFTDLFQTYEALFVVEESQSIGGVAGRIMLMASDMKSNCKIHSIGIPDYFTEHGSVSQLRGLTGLNADKIQVKIKNILHHLKDDQ